jgi:uncharacterized membrane protein YhiD involved in acid resistance
MAVGGGFYAIAAVAAVTVLFALVVLWWVADRFGIKGNFMVFRLTTSNADSVATEVQRLLAGMKVTMQHFRVSMLGTQSIVEFEADVSHHQQILIVDQFRREGVTTEVVPVESRHG